MKEKIKRSRTSLDENDENIFNDELLLKEELAEDNKEQPQGDSEQLDSVSIESGMHIDLKTSSSTGSATSSSPGSSRRTSMSDTTADTQRDEPRLKAFLAELARMLNNTDSAQNNSSSHYTSHPSSCAKLIDTIQYLIKTNRSQRMRKAEANMSNEIGKFLLPRSLANSDDIELLKWLLMDGQNLCLRLVDPIINEAAYTNDHLIYSNQRNMCYLLIAKSLRVKLVEPDEVSFFYLLIIKLNSIAEFVLFEEFIKFYLLSAES